jgi:geranylgeranyl diphosphate synthase type II
MLCLKQEVEDLLEKFISTHSQNDEKLRQLYMDIFKGGKRLRAIIVLAIHASLKHKYPEVSFEYISNLALAMELIHNASLVIDDLPSMDNDMYRRNSKTIHNAYGETVALNVALFLMRQATHMLYLNMQSCSDGRRVFLYNQIIYDNIGKSGLPLGQYLDLGFLKKRLQIADKKQHQDLIYKKTTTLFNLSFLLAFAMHTDNPEEMKKMAQVSEWFGIAFQLYDDFLDIDQDKQNKSPNYILNYGKIESYDVFKMAISNARKHLIELEIEHQFFTEIFDILETQVELRYAQPV